MKNRPAFIAGNLPAEVRWTPGRLALLIALVAAHAVLVYVTVASLFPENPWNRVDPVILRQVVSTAALVLGALAFAQRERAVIAVAAALVVLAIALFMPGTVLTAALVAFNGWLIGDALLRAMQRGDEAKRAPDWGLATTSGLALIIGLACATAAWKVHYAWVYAALAMLPPLMALRNARRLGERAANAWRARHATTAGMRVWLTLLGVVLVLHLFVAAKPEVGYDAQTMHLEFARMLAARHAWHHDVDRFAWAVMPLGADWMFGIAYVLDGERCARLLNLVFALLAGRMLFRLARLGAPALPSLVGVTLFASAPIAFLVTGSLFSEALWSAFALASLLAAIDWLRTRSDASLAALYLAAAGALQTKAISLLWLGPLALALIALSRGAVLRPRTRASGLVAACAIVIGAWPYAEAWMQTGNPLFPFMNGVFHSPLFAGTASFVNPTYEVPLRPWTPYEIVMQSQRFLEGQPGAPGFQWLLLFPVVALALALRRRPRWQWACIALAAAFFVVVYLQQAYLRYLLPALLVAAAVTAWALHDLPHRRATHVAVAVLGIVAIGLNVRFMYTGNWTHATLCRRCAFDADVRRAYVAHYAPLRAVVDWLESNVPGARVGFLVLHDPSPAGYTGYSRAANWHDTRFYPRIVFARTADEVLAMVEAARLTHVVVHLAPGAGEEGIAAFRDRYTQPLWQLGNYRVAVVTGGADAAAAAASR